MIAVIKRELNIILHDTDLKMMLLAAPLFYSLLYGSVYIYKTETKIPLAVIDMDRSVSSRNLVKDLSEHQLIKITGYFEDPELAKDKLIKEEVQGVVFIPKNYESDLRSMKGTGIKLSLNTQRFLHSNDLNKAVNEVVLSEAKDMRTKIFMSKGYSLQQAEELSNPLRDETRFLFNSSETYGDFLIPAILLLILQQTLFMALGQSTAKEKEFNSMDHWHHTAGYNTIVSVLGKSLFYIVMFTAYGLLFFSVHLKLFSVSFVGSYLPFFAGLILLVISMSFLSIIVGSFFSKKLHALIFISFTSYPFFFMSGFSYPGFAMPVVIRAISYLFPITPFMQILNRTVQMGGGFTNVVFPLIHLSIITVLFFLLSLFRLGYTKNNSNTPITAAG